LAADRPLLVNGVGSIRPAKTPFTLATDSACRTMRMLFPVAFILI
jgi:hypothetical protein